MRTFEEKKIVVRFHIGRGGSFHNGGYKTFIGEENLQDVIMSMGENMTIISEDENGKELPRNEWKLIYHDHVVLEGEEIEAETGVIEVDGIYDTDICRYIEDCDEHELELIWEEIELDTSLVWSPNHDELRQAVSELLDRPLVTSMRFYPSNMELKTTLGGWNISRDDYQDMTPEGAIEALMEDYLLTRHDAEKVEDEMENYDWIDY